MEQYNNQNKGEEEVVVKSPVPEKEKTLNGLTKLFTT
jgi:hypothetical protein